MPIQRPASLVSLLYDYLSLTLTKVISKSDHAVATEAPETVKLVDLVLVYPQTHLDEQKHLNPLHYLNCNKSKLKTILNKEVLS